jgi:hypothetical protein
MANPGYVRSSDGDNADDGSTIALSNADLTGAIADHSAGDRIFVASDHAQTQASVLTLNFPGTIASPNQILFANFAAEPPTALVTTGSVTTTGASLISLGGSFYWYGGTISAGTGSSGYGFTVCTGDNRQVYDNTTFAIGGTNSSLRITFFTTSSGTEGSCSLRNCWLKFGATTQGIRSSQGALRISGGGIDGTGAAITNFIAQTPFEGQDVIIEGFDFSAGDASMNLVTTNAAAMGLVVFRNCKLPTSWSGSLLAGAPATAAFRATMHNCSATDTNYQLWEEDIFGSIKDETTIVRTGGASDGDTPIAWKMTSSASASFPSGALNSPPIFIPNTAVGASQTITVEIIHDSVTALDDDEIYVSVQYLGTSGLPLSLFASDAAASVIATPAAQTSSSETWTTTGLTNPNKQKLAVTFTPEEEGLHFLTISLTKASYTVYVDPLGTVS